MLNWRQELGLSPAQVQSLERLRSDFQREATRRDAELRAAETALGTMVQAEPVDLTAVEGKLRDIEKQRADLRLARIKTIEEGKTQLTPEQRAKLSTLLASSAPRRAGTPTTFGRIWLSKSCTWKASWLSFVPASAQVWLATKS